MQKWEYTIVIAGETFGKVYTKRESYKILDYMNWLGEQGWELVSVSQRNPGAVISEKALFFKRPKSQS